MSQFLSSGGQSINFSISPSNEYSGLIYFKIDRYLSVTLPFPLSI